MGLANGRVFLLDGRESGLDGEVVYRIKSGFKHALGALAFWLDGFKLLATYPFDAAPHPLRRRGARRHGRHRGEAPPLWSALLRGAPDAVLEEPKLDVVVLQGTQLVSPICDIWWAFVLRISICASPTSSTSRPTSLDVSRGDRRSRGRGCSSTASPRDYAPVELRVRDDALTVLVP